MWMSSHMYTLKMCCAHVSILTCLCSHIHVQASPPYLCININKCGLTYSHISMCKCMVICAYFHMHAPINTSKCTYLHPFHMLISI